MLTQKPKLMQKEPKPMRTKQKPPLMQKPRQMPMLKLKQMQRRPKLTLMRNVKLMLIKLRQMLTQKPKLMQKEPKPPLMQNVKLMLKRKSVRLKKHVLHLQNKLPKKPRKRKQKQSKLLQRLSATLKIKLSVLGIPQQVQRVKPRLHVSRFRIVALYAL